MIRYYYDNEQKEEFEEPAQFFQYRYAFSIKNKEDGFLHTGYMNPTNMNHRIIRNLATSMNSSLCVYSLKKPDPVFTPQRQRRQSWYIKITPYGTAQTQSISHSYYGIFEMFGLPTGSHLLKDPYEEKSYKEQVFTFSFAKELKDFFSEEFIQAEEDTTQTNHRMGEILRRKVLFCYTLEHALTWNQVREAFSGILTDFELRRKVIQTVDRQP